MNEEFLKLTIKEDADYLIDCLQRIKNEKNYNLNENTVQAVYRLIENKKELISKQRKK